MFLVLGIGTRSRRSLYHVFVFLVYGGGVLVEGLLIVVEGRVCSMAYFFRGVACQLYLGGVRYHGGIYGL